MKNSFQVLWPRAALLLGALILAWHPVLWLIRTWTDPSYDSDGALAACSVAALAIWSLTSPPTSAGSGRHAALICLTVTALVRLASEALGINALGAITLAVDIGAIAAWAGLSRRRRAVSPFWLSALFIFALPVERILQRTIGYLLQSISATGACAVLSMGDHSVTCDGIRILMNGREALVDLPCSGARGLMVLIALFTICAALTRPSPSRAMTGLCVALAAAVVANILRIGLLAAGIAYSETIGLDVMAAPWHDGIGLATLLAASLPVFTWALRVPAPVMIADTAPRSSPRPDGFMMKFAAPAFLAAALVILAVPTHPVDIAVSAPPLQLPAHIGLTPVEPIPLSPSEAEYFTQYGGSAVRGRYGANALTLVRTTAPLRHLHAPDECLRGSGYAVRHMGTSFEDVPTAIYRADAPDGSAWRVDVTFVSARGEYAASVGEAVWLWLKAPGTAWTMIQRATPWDEPDPDFETAARRALDLPDSAPGVTADLSTSRTNNGD